MSLTPLLYHVRLFTGSFHAILLSLPEGYWPFWHISILSCPHLQPQHHVVIQENVSNEVHSLFWGSSVCLWKEMKRDLFLKETGLKKKDMKAYSAISPDQPHADMCFSMLVVEGASQVTCMSWHHACVHTMCPQLAWECSENHEEEMLAWCAWYW